MLFSPQIISNRFTPPPSSFDTATTAWVVAVQGAGGVVSPTQKSRVDTLIVALKAASLFSVNSRLWIHAGESDAFQATIDLMNTSVATVTGHAPGLTAGGYQQASNTDRYIDYGAVPSNYALNTCSFGAANLTSSTSTNFNVIIGAQNTGTTALSDIMPLASASKATVRINQFGGDFTDPSTDNTRKGLFILTSTASGAQALYKNGSSVGTASLQRSTPGQNFYGLARNDSGSASSFSSDQTAVAWIGGALNSTQQGNLATAINNYLTAWGIPAF